MEEPEMMIGPVAETLGVTRTWLLSSDDPLQEHIDLPVSLMVELMDAADCLYPTEEQRWRQLRGWLCRLTGRPGAEFERSAPLMQAVRRQFRLSRDEDLQAVSVWRRAQPAPAELSQLQLTVRPENGARLRRLVQQLGSEEAAIDFLLQMDDNCGKGASLRRTRWPPKVHYESSRGQVKIDVGTEMVCVVLSQFKPAPAPPPEPAPAPAPLPLPTPPAPENVVEVVSAPEVLVVNGHEPAAGAAPAEGAAPPLSLASAYQTVVRDATLPAQMFADDDLAADQLSEVQNQLTSVLDQLAEDSNQMGDIAGMAGQEIVTEQEQAATEQVVSEEVSVVSEQTADVLQEMVVTEQKAESRSAEEPAVTEMAAEEAEAEAQDDMATSAGSAEPSDQVVIEQTVQETTEEVTLDGEEVALEGEEVALEGEEVALDSEEVELEDEEVALDGEEVALDDQEIVLEGQDVALAGEEVALDTEEVALDTEEVALDAEVAIDDQVALEGEEVALDGEEVAGEAEEAALDAELAEVAGDGGAMAEEPASEVLTEVTQVSAEEMAEPLVELPEQLMVPQSTAGPSAGDPQTIVIDADQLADAEELEAADELDEPMVEEADDPMEVGGEAEVEPPAV